ncbi:hypothetical protein BF95_02940 [Sphingobium sp. Ant17]|nr:hypothetical protein BF95_02940 [Sphingobium sp. Ant17]
MSQLPESAIKNRQSHGTCRSANGPEGATQVDVALHRTCGQGGRGIRCKTRSSGRRQRVDDRCRANGGILPRFPIRIRLALFSTRRRLASLPVHSRSDGAPDAGPYPFIAAIERCRSSRCGANASS